MFPGPAELLLIGCLTESTWTQQSKSSMSTPNTNLQDILTKGNFTREEWNNLLHLFNVSHFSSLCRSQDFSLTSCTKTMAKRMQEQRKERIGSWQSQSQRRWTWSSYVSTSSSTVQNPVASKSLEILKAPCRTDWLSTGKPDAKEDNQDAALSSQGWQKDAVLDGCRYEETGRFRKLRNRRQWQSLATQFPCINKIRAAHGEGFLDRGQRYGLSPMNQMKNLYFCLSLFKPQFILEQTIRRICDLPGINPRNHWDSYFKWLIGCSSSCGERRLCWLTELFTLQLPKPTSFLTQCHVWEVSVLNQSKHGKAGTIGFWKRYFKDLDRIDGEPMEFEWKPSHDSLHCRFSTRFKSWWLNQSVNLSNSQEGSSSCQCAMTLMGENKETKEIVLRMLSELPSMLEDSREDIGRFQSLDRRRNGMLLNFAERGHPIFRATSALERGELKSKGKGIKSIHFNGSDDTIELTLRTIISVSQLSVYGAVADVCGEWARDSKGAGRTRSGWECGINGYTDRISYC